MKPHTGFVAWSPDYVSPSSTDWLNREWLIHQKAKLLAPKRVVKKGRKRKAKSSK